MLKFLQSRDEVVDLIHTLAEAPALQSFRIGVAGSYLTGLNKKGSPIDIVLKLKEGQNKDLISLGLNPIEGSRYQHTVKDTAKDYAKTFLDDFEKNNK